MAASKQQKDKGKKQDQELTAEELKAIKDYESGKMETETFENADHFLKEMHKRLGR